MNKHGPTQQRYRSEQDVGTPPEFLVQLVDRFGPISMDLAATAKNKVAPRWLGPGSPDGEDALAVDWATLGEFGHWFLNPPHGNVAPFVKKCAEQAPAIPGVITVLIQAAVGTNWFAKYVGECACVIPIRPRIKFIGHKHPYPKDLMVCVYGRYVVPAFTTWDWKKENWKKECPF